MSAPATMTKASRFAPRRSLADLLGKRWMEPVVPFLVMVVVAAYFVATTPGMLTAGNVANLEQELAILSLLALGMGATIIAGGIDISVVGTYSVLNFALLVMIKVWELPILASIGIALVAGMAIGLFNGWMIAYLKVRPFLMTLAVLLVMRSVVNILSQRYNSDLAIAAPIDDPLWAFLSAGTVAGIQTSLALVLLLALGCHLVLSRLRLGAHIVATGASKRGAKNAGIAHARISMGSYVFAGLMAACTAVLQAANLESGSARIGDGLEFSVLTALILGGISLGGGRGTVARVFIGTIVVVIIANGFSLRTVSASALTITLALALLAAVVIDQKWAKNRDKAISKISLDPGRLVLPARPELVAGSGGLFEENDRLSKASAIGLGRVEGPEDCIVDAEGRVYCGDRRGWIWRFSGPDHEHAEVFARVGGSPLGLAFDGDGNLLVCASGRGVYRVSPDGEPSLVADLTKRTRWSLLDDSRLRLVDDLDISPDGRIWFSEASKRFEVADWILDIVEGRPNGRLLCHDPATGTTRTVLSDLPFPNGVCVSHDAQSVLFALTTASQVLRLHIAGPREGEVEVVIDGLPGFCDNINRASDGTYWLAFAGVRNPSYDLAMTMPGFRRRMVKQLPHDDWIFPNANSSFIIKFTEDGEVVDVLWDKDQTKHALATSMREFRGSLYIGGLTNNRVGRLQLPPSDVVCDCGQPPCCYAAGEPAGSTATSVKLEEVSS